MAELETIKVMEEIVEEALEETIEEIEEMAAPPASGPAEKPGMFGQTPSMWFLIDSSVVFLIVLIMRFVA